MILKSQQNIIELVTRPATIQNQKFVTEKYELDNSKGMEAINQFLASIQPPEEDAVGCHSFHQYVNSFRDFLRTRVSPGDLCLLNFNELLDMFGKSEGGGGLDKSLDEDNPFEKSLDDLQATASSAAANQIKARLSLTEAGLATNSIFLILLFVKG